MKLLSLWEPWATLMAIEAKRIETRSWQTPYRGWLAIHASKGGLAKAQLREVLADHVFADALSGVELKPGHILAVVDLTGCISTESALALGISAHEKEFGDYHPSRWAWFTKDVFRLPTPIPYKASQGLCDVPLETLTEIRRQWKESKR